MTIPILLSQLNPGEGFGFNTNVLETNVINLAVVIGVVVSFGGDALRSLLENRKQTILNNLREVEQKANEAQARVIEAKNRLQLAQTKAAEIRQQGNVTAEQEKKQCIRQTQEDAARLEELQQETFRFQQQKAIHTISQQVVSLALNRVREKLQKRLDTRFHAYVNNFSIVLFTNYKAR